MIGLAVHRSRLIKSFSFVRRLDHRCMKLTADGPGGPGSGYDTRLFNDILSLLEKRLLL